MNMIDVNGQLANIAQICRKTPTTTLRRAYVRAMREWCQQTQWLRVNIPGATAVNVRQYAIGNDANLDVVGIKTMTGSQSQAQGIQYWPLVPSDSGQWDTNMQPGMPVRYQYVPEAQFALDPLPKSVFGLEITLILQPKENAVNVPEAPLLKYSNEIEAGALEYLLSIPGMPWSSPALAQNYGKAFRAGIANGKAEVQRNYNTGPQRARLRQFIL